MKTPTSLTCKLTLALIALLTSASSYATTYEPTVFENDSQVTDIFNGMETGFKQLKPILLRSGSECTQRAETWSYDLAVTKNVRLQKVFVFYTHAYQDYYYKTHGKYFKWWFHVSPFLLVKGENGAPEERVIDRTFADKPQTMKQWTDIFIESKEACVENVPFSEFEGDVSNEGKSYNKAAHCYIVRAPMYDLFPKSVEAREKGLKTSLEWDLDEVRYAVKALTSAARKKFLARTGL
ncbi:MAG: hypothetical protein JST80_09695 [Bdellovibrionales bacterium]|nr:hypothetical protein [Bdellovibrionales bacterium]